MTSNGLQKRILFVSVLKRTPWGGSEELWSRTAIRLSEAGQRVTASIPYWPNPDPALSRLRTAGCRVAERTPRRAVTLTLRAVGRDPDLWRAERFLRSEDPDFVVISCGGFAEDLWWGQACRAQRIPYVIVAQAAAEMWWPTDEELKLVRSVYEAAERVCFVSQRNMTLVENMLGARIPNGDVVRNPFNVDYHSFCPYPSTEPFFNLACIGRLELYAKGQDLLLELLGQEKWKNRNLKVSFFGKGPNSESLKALSRFQGVENVEFRGHVGSIQDVWKNHHLLVLPSRLEGLPLVLVEAMLCGRPAVVTNVAGNSEVLDDNETGFLAAAPTTAHFDEAMERAWQRRYQWEDMGREAARRIRLAVPEDPVGVFADQLMKLAIAA